MGMMTIISQDDFLERDFENLLVGELFCFEGGYFMKIDTDLGVWSFQDNVKITMTARNKVNVVVCEGNLVITKVMVT